MASCFIGKHRTIDVPRPLTNDLWVFLFQTIDAECVKGASPAVTYMHVYVKAFIVNVNKCTKVSKGAKIRNRYNQVPHLTQDTNGKVANLQLDTTHESQVVSPFRAGDHKAHINRRAQRHSKHKTEKKPIKDPQKKYRLGTVNKIFYWMA